MGSRARLLLLPLALVLLAAVWTPTRNLAAETSSRAAACVTECAPAAVHTITDRAADALPDGSCIQSIECAGAMAFAFGAALAVVVVASVVRPTQAVPVRVDARDRTHAGREPVGGVFRPPRQR